MKFHFGRNSCLPFSNCSLTNGLVDSILNLNEEQDIGLLCAHTSSVRPSSRYTLMCQTIYDDIQETIRSVETGGSHELVFMVVILVCVVIIICLSINTYRLTKKVNKQRNRLNRDISRMSSM